MQVTSCVQSLFSYSRAIVYRFDQEAYLMLISMTQGICSSFKQIQVLGQARCRCKMQNNHLALRPVLNVKTHVLLLLL